VRFGLNTARALSRYLRAGTSTTAPLLPNLWPAEGGTQPLLSNGNKIRLKRVGGSCWVADVNAYP